MASAVPSRGGASCACERTWRVSTCRKRGGVQVAIDDVSTGEIVRRLDELKADVRDMSRGYVRTELWLEQRGETGRRIGDIEKDMGEMKAHLQKEIDATRASIETIKVETDRRYRTTVNLALGAFLSFLGGAALMLIQLVAK